MISHSSKKSVLLYFLTHYRAKTALLYSSQIFLGFIEALSIAMLLPLFSIILGNGASGDSVLQNLFLSAFDFIGISGQLEWVIAAIICVFVVKAFVKYGIMRYLSKSYAGIVADFRQQYLNSLLHSNWSFYTHKPIGHFLNALFAEAQRCGAIYKTLGDIIAVLLQMAALLVVALLISWELVLFSTLCAAFIWLFLFRFIRITGHNALRQKDLSKEINAQVADLLQHYKPLKAMRAEEAVFEKVKTNIIYLYEVAFKQMMAKETLPIVREAFLVALISVGLYFSFVVFKVPAAEIFIMAAVFYRLMTSLSQFQQSYQTYVAQESFFWSFLESDQEAREHREIISDNESVDFKNAINFKDVSFAFNEKKILRKVSFSLPAHKFMALTGPSGTGKTTILDLICGLYTPDDGEIMVDGVSTSQLNRHVWRKEIGYVPQEFVIFHDTIRNNITLNDGEISDEDVWSALKKAKADEFVSNLPDGLDTILGEKGSLISGGQRQRISIARALAKRPTLLILDEATASLDPQTEKSILQALKELTSDTTIVAISHQPHLKEFADLTIDLEAIQNNG